MRYLIIIRELKLASHSHPKPLSLIQDKVRDELGYDISMSTLEKDVHFLRHDTDFGIHAPIMAVGSGGRKPEYGVSYAGYYLAPNWRLSDRIKEVWNI